MEPFTLKLLILIGIVVGSFGLGWLIARSLRLRDVSGKIGAILFTLGLGLSPFIDTMVVQHKPWYEALKFGIDLAGGTNLVYQLEKTPTDGGMMDRLVGALRRRIDPAGTQELTIRQVGADRVEMIIPRATAEDIATIKRKVDRVGSLEFQILANDRDHKELIRSAATVDRDIRRNGKLVAGWRPIAPIYETVKGQRVEKPNPEFRQSGGIAVRPIPGRPEFDEVLVIFDPNP